MHKRSISLDPSVGHDPEPELIYIDEKGWHESELIKGVWGELYSPDQVKAMTFCEQVSKLGKIYTNGK